MFGNASWSAEQASRGPAAAAKPVAWWASKMVAGEVVTTQLKQLEGAALAGRAFSLNEPRNER